ncbi:MAG TPA: 30S ribosomal protein S8 [Bacteroidetes bacterium]|nr:30S ribosomal protein S8 [Bacteroidota bacterium]
MSRVTDPIADYLTRIRNAIRAGHRRVDIPASRIKREITRILVDEGYIRDYLNIDDGQQGILRVFLKFDRQGKSAITDLQRVSRPGLRRYVGVDEIPRVRNGLGVAVLSTPKGLLTGGRAKQENVGGEVLLYIW